MKGGAVDVDVDVRDVMCTSREERREDTYQRESSPNDNTIQRE